VFYNLNCLPDIVLVAIDTTIRSFVEATVASLDLDSLFNAHNELINSTSGAPAQNVSTSMGSLVAATTKPVKKSQSNFAQMRVAMREISYNWTSHIHEHAMQINVLQRVISKKEDPTTHKKFSDVLRHTVSNNPSLASGRLLDVFWERLCTSLQDMANEKVKSQSAAAARIYPCLRKAALETLSSLEALSSKDRNRDTLSSGQASNAFGADFGINNFGVAGSLGSDNSSVFGSSLWSPGELVLGAIGVNRKGNGLRKVTQRESDSRLLSSNTMSVRHLGGGGGGGGGGVGGGSSSGGSMFDELIEAQGLIAGLRPMRDRYLASALQRMTTPVQQMFPEMAG